MLYVCMADLSCLLVHLLSSCEAWLASATSALVALNLPSVLANVVSVLLTSTVVCHPLAIVPSIFTDVPSGLTYNVPRHLFPQLCVL
jgi:hypothetical protein